MTVEILAGCLVVSGLIILRLIYRLVLVNLKLQKQEPVYVDTSGIDENPPKFIEVVKNKTINFVLGKEKISIMHLSVTKGLNRIEKIAGLFYRLHEEFKKEYNTKLQKLAHTAIKKSIYNQIVIELYKLCKPFAKRKRRFRKELYKKASNDFEWTCLVIEQVFDYWAYVGKLQALLSRGGSIRQILGGNFSWSYTDWGLSGKPLIKPRFVSSMN
jgi:hypothetical protein